MAQNLYVIVYILLWCNWRATFRLNKFSWQVIKWKLWTWTEVSAQQQKALRSHFTFWLDYVLRPNCSLANWLDKSMSKSEVTQCHKPAI